MVKVMGDGWGEREEEAKTKRLQRQNSKKSCVGWKQFTVGLPCFITGRRTRCSSQ